MELTDERSFYNAIKAILKYLEEEEFDRHYGQKEMEKIVRVAYFSGYIDKEHQLPPRFPYPKKAVIRPFKS